VIAGSKTEESSTLNASILDMKNVQSVAEIEATAEGSGRAGFIVLIPYVFIPETATIVCKAIAKRDVGYFRGDPQAPPEGGLRSD
jgi:hypothetical protein